MVDRERSIGGARLDVPFDGFVRDWTEVLVGVDDVVVYDRRYRDLGHRVLGRVTRFDGGVVRVCHLVLRSVVSKRCVCSLIVLTVLAPEDEAFQLTNGATAP